MAKKRQQNRKQQPSTSSVNTSTPIKGMIKDVDSAYFSKENWWHARNLANNSIDGDTGVVGNEPANLSCGEVPYTIIGTIHLYGDKWVLYSTDDSNSEIGLFDDSKCEYETLINAPCLNFNRRNLIIGAAKENFDCTWQVYWDDNLNPSRTLNIDNVPYVQQVVSGPGDPCVIYEDTDQLDCEKLRLHPLMDMACLRLEKADEGGSLLNGSYQAFIAYCDKAQQIGDYFISSNITSVWSHENTNSSIILHISDLDTDFEFFKLVIRERVANVPRNIEFGVYSTETKRIPIDFIDPELPTIDNVKLLIDNPVFEKSAGMFVVNDYLIRSQPTEYFDFNYQPLANQIKTYWTSVEYPDDYYRDGGNNTTFLRDEQYAFFIRFIYNTGEFSKSYHIPGRGPHDFNGVPSDSQLLNGTNNTISNGEYIYNVYNTAEFLPADPFVASLIGSTTPDGEGIVTGGGLMGFWQSSEVYPQTQPERYNASAHPWSNPGTTEFDLCGLPIRHHKIPDETVPATSTLTGNNCTSLYNPSNSTINVIGVAFDNIAPPVDNDGNLIENIVGYQIMVGSRDGKKSIIGKGIIKNMMRFRTEKDGDFDGLVPNYPYNDLRVDPYLLARRQGNRSNEPWYAQLFGWDSTVEDNWMAGNTSMANRIATSINGSDLVGETSSTQYIQGHPEAGHFDINTYTFHSPDLNFTKTYLNPTEVKIYKHIYGPVTGRFKTVEDHTQHKLLKNKVVTLAAIYGVGYAIMKMRGERNYSLSGTRSYSTGEINTYPGVGGAPTPVAGTGLAATNALIQANPLTGQAPMYGLEWLAAGAADGLAPLGVTSEVNKALVLTNQTLQLGVAAQLAGHVGPEFNTETKDSEYNAVPLAGTLVVGILTFINYVAIGGDKLVQLILDLVSFQDYALKYISHGFYKFEASIGRDNNAVNFRAGIDRARYIKQAIQSFDGDVVVQNLLRPSTVVLRHKGDNAADCLVRPPFDYLDNTKFTVGAGPCAGTHNNQGSWWTLGEEIKSRCSAPYVSIKNQIDNQYGQLDSIIQLPIFGCTTSYPRSKETGEILPYDQNSRFSTQVLFGGDSYIARYTEKTNMPFFYQFLKDNEERGYQFNYSRYANIPFPRYWMNTEKYRMGEFVEPIQDLSFDWSGNLPDGMYNLDTPENGGYCPDGGPGSISNPPSTFSFDGMGAGTTTGSAIGSGGQNASNIFTPTAPPATGAPPPPPTDVSYVPGAEAQRYIVHNVTVDPVNITFNQAGTNGSCTTNGISISYPNTTALDQDVRQELIDSGVAGGTVNISITLSLTVPQAYTIPLGTGGGGNCDIDTHLDEQTGTSSCVESWPVATAQTAGTVQFTGSMTGLRIIFDWQTQTVIGVTSASAGTKYAAYNYSAASGGVNPYNQTPYTGTQVPTTNDIDNIGFSSNSEMITTSTGCIFELKSGLVTVTGGQARCRNSSNNKGEITLSVSGNSDAISLDNSQAGLDNYNNSAYNPNNYTGGGDRRTGGLFVWKYGYMYTHNSGINDFWVETDINLAYRDYEDVKRKRHYDDQEYTDLVELFHSQIIGFDNYYNYDKSLGVRRFWGVSFSKIQERWYDATTAEQCFTQYPKRLIYSVPATGFAEAAKFTNKNDKAIDFWRVFLSENYRDFKAPLNAIVPFNQTGALMLFPTLSPKVFQGVDKLQLTRKKVVIGDGGLFSQVLQNAANSNVSHEFGSCESYRSVLNTPQGVYFVSQAQGKIFLYQAGKGLQAISDIGMKWWFNKFLPSRLLADFPDTEDCPEFIDNPVIAAGINTVYDPNDDIVYFCKRDYKAHDHILPCLDFIPCEGFVYNATTCDGAAQQVECPEGYTFTPGSTTCPPGYSPVSCLDGSPCCQQTGSGLPPVPVTVTPDQCCQTTTTPALFTQDGQEVDIVIAVDSSNSVDDNGNVQGMKDIVNNIIHGLDNAQTTSGQIRIGLVHFGSGRGLLVGNLHNVTVNTYTNGDTMFNVADQLALTDDFSLNGDLYNWMQSVYEPAALSADVPSGTEIAAGIWNAMNLLYGFNSRPNAKKRLITLADGYQYTKDQGTYMFSYDPTATPTMRDTNQVAGTVSPLTPDLNLGPTDEASNPGTGVVYTVPSAAGNWFQANIINNTNYADQKSFFIGLDTVQGSPAFVGTPNPNQQDYFNQFANANDPNNQYTFFGTLQDQSDIQNIVDSIVNEVMADPEFYCPDENCDLIQGLTPVCRCEECVDPTLVDVTYPVDLQDEQYFEDVSWTVSYDPKSKAWISFHDWHPELTMNSINHFLTTKSKINDVPICPPGYTWNGTECCINQFQQAEAVPIINEILAEVNTVGTTNQGGKVDVVFSIDRTLSTAASTEEGGDTVLETQLKFVESTINFLSNAMASGAVRVAHGAWNSSSTTAVQQFTSDPSTAIASLFAGSYTSNGGTDYKKGIQIANQLVANGTTGGKVICIYITDSATDLNFTLNYTVNGFPADCTTNLATTEQIVNFDSQFTDVFLVQAKPGENGDGCDNENWQYRIAGVLDRFNFPSAYVPRACTTCESCLQYPYTGNGGDYFATTSAICNDGIEQNPTLFQVTQCTDPNTCNTHYESVASRIISSIFDCECPENTILDQNPDNPDCTSEFVFPQCIVNCTCPPGYVLIGECNNSANPPICRSVDCACPPSEDLGLPPGLTPTTEGNCALDLVETVNTTTIESTEADGTNVGQQVFMTNPGFNVDPDDTWEGPFNLDGFGIAMTPKPWRRGYKCTSICGEAVSDPNDPSGNAMTPDTLPYGPYLSGTFGPTAANGYVGLSQGSNLSPNEGNAYIGLAEIAIAQYQPLAENICCGGPGGIDEPGTDPYYYQEGVWQRLLDANGTPTEMEFNIEYTGRVYLSQLGDIFSKKFDTRFDGTYELVVQAEQDTDYAPSIEIWAGTHEPGTQGQNYKGYQFDYPSNDPSVNNGLGNDEYGYSVMLWRSGPVTSIDDWVEYQYSLNANDDGSIEAQYGKLKYIFIKIQAVRVNDGLPVSLAYTTVGSKYVVVDGFSNPRIPTVTETVTTTTFDTVVTSSTLCTYINQECVPANYISGGIWRHNVRTDLFANFYNVQYPWEVDIIETTGQTVNTLRSVEYHLESYFYSEDQLNRFHDLDYNFDEAVIYNSEQISGLLNLVLTPKNNSPLTMSYPIINANSIDVLFSKEEQKYRFNQFFDITNDRGEFSGAITQMFETEQNGYIINLNPLNLNYNKPQHERKKFRHYFNHLILRKSADAAMTRKMLLRLENFKLNVSFR